MIEILAQDVLRSQNYFTFGCDRLEEITTVCGDENKSFFLPQSINYRIHRRFRTEVVPTPITQQL